jgi:hypothetical protein
MFGRLGRKAGSDSGQKVGQSSTATQADRCQVSVPNGD